MVERPGILPPTGTPSGSVLARRLAAQNVMPHIYAEELDAALRRSVNHLLKTHKNIIPDCADLLSQAPGEISSDARSV